MGAEHVLLSPAVVGSRLLQGVYLIALALDNCNPHGDERVFLFGGCGLWSCSQGVIDCPCTGRLSPMMVVVYPVLLFSR